MDYLVVGDSIVSDAQRGRIPFIAHSHVFSGPGCNFDKQNWHFDDRLWPGMQKLLTESVLNKVVVHLGTNGVEKISSNDFCDQLHDFYTALTRLKPNAYVAYSSILLRKHCPATLRVNHKIVAANRVLKKFCEENSCLYIDQTSFNTPLLNIYTCPSMH